ncbi:hypothetical protein BH10BAC1_BH10BAC1_15330 [soil metagenome]
MEEKDKPKTAWRYVRTYFPDIWQYIVIIIVMILAAIFIL